MSDQQQPGLWVLIREDFEAHGRDWFRPGFRALAVYRFGRWRMSIRWRPLRVPLSLLYRFLYRRCAYVYGIEIPFTATIGRRVTIEHQHGIVIHGGTVIGDECIVRQGVTLGIRDERFLDQAPRLGKRVSIGAGAKILGQVSIGDDVKIGANAVVLHDLPAGCTAVGIPAKPVFRRGSETHRGKGTNKNDPSRDVYLVPVAEEFTGSAPTEETMS